MAVSETEAAPHLIFDKLEFDPKLARSLPRALAFRYRALPVARGDGFVTVAMADPNDESARQALTSALGTELYVVQGDDKTITKLLAEIWPKTFCDGMRLLVCDYAGETSDEVKAYAEYLGDLLGCQFSHCHWGQKDAARSDNLLEEIDFDCDIVILGDHNQSMARKLRSGSAEGESGERVASSLLIARQPRWPLTRILMISRGYVADDVAVDWTIRLAEPSAAAVTILAIMPPMPASYSQSVFVRWGLANRLSSDTNLGRQMRRMALQLASWDTQGRLRFRQGAPDRQIRNELAEEDYDLIVVAADPVDWRLRRLLGELTPPLLRWASQPVLVARPGVN